MKSKLGHYEIQSELGRGGMGVVYKAWDPTLGRSTAIKVLSEALSHDPAIVERFTREARSMAALNNPNILQIYFIGEDHGQPYFVMEFVEGQTLAQRIKREGKLPLGEALRILKETASGLAAAHARGVIHRDIKPGNLMLTHDGHVRIADFGIAMVSDIQERLTNTGEFVGTPGYVSPEICIGRPIDHRTDIFALGVVLYEMLTGRLPFEDVSPLGMMVKVVKSEVPDIRTLNSSVDARTSAILARMIAKDPSQRYQSCDEILADLAGHTAVAAPGAPTPAFIAETQALSELPTQLMEGITPTEILSAPTPTTVRPLAVAPSTLPAAPPSPRRQPAGPVIAVAAALVIAVSAAAALVYRGGNTDAKPAETTASRAQIPLTQETAPAPAAPEAAATQASSPAAPTAPVAAATVTAAASAATPSTVAATPVEPPAAIAPSVPAAPAAPVKPIQTAKLAANPAPAAPVAKPQARRVVVVATGDPAIALPAERQIEDVLHDRGVEMLDETVFPGFRKIEGRERVDVAQLSDLVRRNGADVLVLAEVQYLGERDLHYYGRTSTLYTTNLNVRAVLLSERRALGRGWSRKVEFTDINAELQANAALTPVLQEIADSVAGKKPQE